MPGLGLQALYLELGSNRNVLPVSLCSLKAVGQPNLPEETGES